ncbi:hypothetical protein ACHAXS_011542 [Conticribra weissflogii]
MKLQALALAAKLVQISAAEQWYPDWTGGSGTCLNDGNHPYSMEISGIIEPTIEDCCSRYYSSRVQDCIIDGGGTAPTGSGKFYVNYEQQRCDSDCQEGTGTCGGYATPVDNLYGAIDECCSKKLGYIALGLCSHNSLRTAGDYPGTAGWKVDYENNRCVQDCKTVDAACVLPGGVVLDSYTTLYNDAATCCAGKLSSIDSDICESRSDPTSTGTLKYYVDSTNNMCLVDSDASSCPIGATCVRAPPTATLYTDAAACCSGGLKWVTSEYCETRSAGTTSNLWYSDGTMCVQDCVGVAPCKKLTNAYADLDADEDACCTNQLGWMDNGICVATSVGGTTPSGSGNWYVDYENKRCVQDCPTSTTGSPCGGLAESHEQLFTTAAACCASRLSYFAAGFCEANSLRTPYLGSFDWYVDYQTNLCVQDCDSGVTCGGIIEDSSTFLHADASTCCNEKLRWLNQDTCTSNSEAGSAATPTGNSEWYSASNGEAKCVRNCAAGGECGGILDATSSKPTYADIADCCSAHFGHVDADLCAAISQLGYTDKWYVDYQNNRCQQDCVAASNSPCAGNPTDMSVTLYADANKCCADKLSYLNAATCYANSLGIAPTGSGKFYVDWQITKCVADCDKSQGGSCNGLADNWETLYADATTCCKKLSWLAFDKCLYTA